MGVRPALPVLRHGHLPGRAALVDGRRRAVRVRGSGAGTARVHLPAVRRRRAPAGRQDVAHRGRLAQRRSEPAGPRRRPAGGDPAYRRRPRLLPRPRPDRRRPARCGDRAGTPDARPRPDQPVPARIDRPRHRRARPQRFAVGRRRRGHRHRRQAHARTVHRLPARHPPVADERHGDRRGRGGDGGDGAAGSRGIGTLLHRTALADRTGGYARRRRQSGPVRAARAPAGRHRLVERVVAGRVGADPGGRAVAGPPRARRR